MRILSFVTNRYAPFYQNQVESLSNHDITVDHVSPRKQSPDYNKRQKITRTHLDYLPLLYESFKKITHGYDIIHANNGITAPFALIQLNHPVVLSFWGSDLMDINTRMCQICSKLADHVIIPSRAMEPYLNCKYTILPFGVDVNLFSPISQTVARQKIGWNTEKNIILFPYSRTRTIKNYQLAKRVVEQIEGAELREIPGVPYDEMPLYMNASDAVLVTSKRESGPMVVKEAALCNVPVVSTDVGFASEVLSDVENSYVCSSEREFKDRLEIIIKSRERSDGRKHADEWGLDKMGERLVDMYESVLEKE